jgi:hypothetical protein
MKTPIWYVLSSSSVARVVDRRAALVKPERQSFADLYVASQSSRWHDEKRRCAFGDWYFDPCL